MVGTRVVYVDGTLQFLQVRLVDLCLQLTDRVEVVFNVRGAIILMVATILLVTTTTCKTTLCGCISFLGAPF